MKAILVMEMPKNCYMCAFYDEDYCGIPGCGEDITDYIACRPDFCPLTPMPERREFNGENAIKSPSLSGRVTEAMKEAITLGWNACLDAIEGRKA